MASSTGCAQRGRSVRSGHARTPRQPSTWPRTRQTFIPNRALRALQELHPALYHNQIRTMCTDCGFEQRQDMYLPNHGLAKDCPYISGSQDPLLPQDSRPGDIVSRRTCSIISEISTFHLLVVSLVLVSGTNSPPADVFPYAPPAAPGLLPVYHIDDLVLRHALRTLRLLTYQPVHATWERSTRERPVCGGCLAHCLLPLPRSLRLHSLRPLHSLPTRPPLPPPVSNVGVVCLRE